MEIRVTYSDFKSYHYDSTRDAQDAILDAHADGVSVEYIEDENGTPYSCIWTVLLQKEE